MLHILMGPNEIIFEYRSENRKSTCKCNTNGQNWGHKHRCFNLYNHEMYIITTQKITLNVFDLVL